MALSFLKTVKKKPALESIFEAMISKVSDTAKVNSRDRQMLKMMSFFSPANGVTSPAKYFAEALPVPSATVPDAAAETTSGDD